MAPKTPKTPQSAGRILTRAEWKTCVSCTATFPTRDSLKHEAVCSAIAAGELTLPEINHGFILHRKLHGIIEESGCKECLQLAGKVQATHVLLVSPSAMQLCGMEIGSHVLAESGSINSKQSTFIAWPCSHIQPAAFVANSEGILMMLYQIIYSLSINVYFIFQVLKVLDMDKQKGLRISAVRGERQPAGHLRIQLNRKAESDIDGSLNLKQLEEAFLHQFDEHPVRPGITLVLKYFGKKWAVRVQSCDGSDETNLSSAMAALSVLNSTSDPPQPYFLVLSSTRVQLVAGAARSGQPSVVPIGLDDFGGARDVVDEVKRICSAVFQQQPDMALSML